MSLVAVNAKLRYRVMICGISTLNAIWTELHMRGNGIIRRLVPMLGVKANAQQRNCFSNADCANCIVIGDCSGRPGPGPRTMWVGFKSATSCSDLVEFNRPGTMMTSAPRVENAWMIFQENESRLSTNNTREVVGWGKQRPGCQRTGSATNGLVGGTKSVHWLSINR